MTRDAICELGAALELHDACLEVQPPMIKGQHWVATITTGSSQMTSCSALSPGAAIRGAMSALCCPKPEAESALLAISKAEAEALREPVKYNFEVQWSPGDQEFVGYCKEFPSLSHLAATQAEALAGIQALVAQVISEGV